jgi:tRNA1(Val) A37 N6-methylase TrmN6
MAETSPELTRDAWFGGRLTLWQPREGHRVGADAALLAAAAGPAEGEIVDVGAGIGAVGLAILTLSAGARADLVEIDPELAELARRNADENGLSARARAFACDVTDPAARRRAGLIDGTAGLVVTNPPFFAAGAVRASPKPGRAQAHVLAAGAAPLAAWLGASLALLAPGGRFVMIHRPDSLRPILEALENRLGAVALLPVHPRPGTSAIRILVAGVKGSRAPLRFAPPLVLHQANGALTPLADALHRGEQTIDWGA